MGVIEVRMGSDGHGDNGMCEGHWHNEWMDEKLWEVRNDERK